MSHFYEEQNGKQVRIIGKSAGMIGRTVSRIIGKIFSKIGQSLVCTFTSLLFVVPQRVPCVETFRDL